MQSLSEIAIQFVKGVGPVKARLLQQLGIESVEDLLYLFPRRYEDRSNFVPMAMVKAGEVQTVAGHVLAVGKRNFYSKNRSFEILVGDKTGRLSCVWFNQPYLDKYFKEGQEIVLYGRVDVFKNRLQMVVPDFELIAPEERSLNMGRIVPIYPLTKGITQRYLRKLIDACLTQYSEQMQDCIPSHIRRAHGLEHLKEGICHIHFPTSIKEQQQAIERISFEEFFLFQISVILRRMNIVAKKGITHDVSEIYLQKLITDLPFTLTKAQHKAIGEIILDMKKPRPMLRLIQGDVGSGKTIVAFMSAACAIANGHQAAIMAPTEILAQQHFLNFQKLQEAGAFDVVRPLLLTSSAPKKEKEISYKDIKEGNANLIIGTHALLEETVVFHDLSFVVIDEQHKFGVGQRALLSTKGKNPDVLIMTATPIPRTLCLTLYGDLDVSTIDELPPGRGTIKTYAYTSEKSQSVYQKVRELVLKGTQAYIIYPLVEESEKLDLKAAKDMYEHLAAFEFQGLRLGLVHGQMPKAEVDEIMGKFKQGHIDVLVATTILEVGIDVPNANVMVIEHAERFGLSQLHQLRGRIGRGKKNAICVLIADARTAEGKARLDAILSTTDGFKIAQSDLEIRGPGHYFGRHQHGLNELKMANPITQMALLEKARAEAIELLRQDPQLSKDEDQAIKTLIKKRYPQYLDLILAG